MEGVLPKKKNYSKYSLKSQNGPFLVIYFQIWIFIAFSFCICTKNFKIHTLVHIVNLKTSIFSTLKIIFFNHFMSNNQSFGWLGSLPYKNESCQSIMRQSEDNFGGIFSALNWNSTKLHNINWRGGGTHRKMKIFKTCPKYCEKLGGMPPNVNGKSMSFGHSNDIELYFGRSLSNVLVYTFIAKTFQSVQN